MTCSGPSHVIARHAIDEIAKFNGETETLKYMNVFIMQEIAKARHFIRTLREEAQTKRISLAQVRAMVAEMELQMIMMSIMIVLAKKEISTLESHLEIMDAAINSE
nr:hypothetical protein [Tanacetum cinerariifolium]